MSLTARFLFAILLGALLFSCKGKKDQTASEDPISADSLINPEKMILIMADVHVVEAALQVQRNEGGESRNNSNYLYNGIFKKYGISADRYDQNLSFYRKDPGEFAKMYEKVITVIENRQKFTGVK